VATGLVSWEQELVATHDFLATIMDVFNVSRPAHRVQLAARAQHAAAVAPG